MKFHRIQQNFDALGYKVIPTEGFYITTLLKNFKDPERLFVLLNQFLQRDKSLNLKLVGLHCVNYAKRRVFSDPYIPVQEQNFRFCPYRGI